MNRVERSCMVAIGVLALTAAVRWHSVMPMATSTAAADDLSVRSFRVVADSELQEAEDITVGNDPFRLSNAPSDIRYDPLADGVPLASRPATPVVVRPTFVLKAIVGGPPWQAVIDGFPGQPTGIVVRAGNKYDRLLVRAVTRDSVVVQGPDTSWVLVFGRRR